MGGIDCRYLTTHLQSPEFSILSVTTIASPHRGSAFADHFLATLGKERLPSFLSFLDLLPNGGGDGKAFEFLTVALWRGSTGKHLMYQASRFVRQAHIIDLTDDFPMPVLLMGSYVPAWSRRRVALESRCCYRERRS
jgi:hypothetical protein